MSFIYHIVPKNMVGTRLIPLNRMRESNLEIYLKESAKYRGREKLMERYIPKADCLWNDVLHFSSVSPEIIFSRFENLGFGKFDGLKWFEVPISQVEGLVSVIYRAPQQPRPNFELDDSDIEFLDASSFQELQTLPEQFEDYLMSCKVQGNVPMPFQFIPHVLVRGEIETKGLKVISR